jgi:hypothetical protein
VVMDHLHWTSFAQSHSPAKVVTDRQLHRSSGLEFHIAASLALALVAFCSLTALVGCSSGSAKSQSQSSQTPIISVAMTQLPPATLPVTTQAQVAATVANDPANAGVDWIALCGNSTSGCGSFSPAHTASGAVTTFTAPAGVPAQKTVAVTALSTTDHSKSSAFAVTIVSTVTSITITQFPPPTAAAGSTITLSATVVGDPANLGVDWTANCGGINCTPGNFHSSSGGTVNFVIPLPNQVTGIVGSTVTITAYATADHTFSATTSFQVSAPIVLTITQSPPATMLTNATATVVATVQNDPTNSGVAWSVSCSDSPCGTITPGQTASGAPATFTAPAAAAGTVQIFAQAIAGGSAQLATQHVNVTIVAPVSVTIIQGVTNSTIVQNTSASLIATTANDSANAGIDWSVTCGSPGSCGTFSPAHTASGAATTYSAPPAIPTSGTVTITAASTTDPAATATQTVTVTAAPPPNSLLSGSFVMLLSSNNSQSGAYVVGGVISGDGNGNITNANFDLVDATGNGGSSIPILSPSTYSLNLNGQGQMQLLINTGGLGKFGVTGAASPCGSTPNCGSLTLTVVFVTPEHATLSESDTFGTATGTLDLQNLQSFSGTISPGVYSLSLSGSELAQSTAAYSLASAVTIPSTTSYSYITDQSIDGVITSVPFTTLAKGFANGGFSGGLLNLYSVNLGLPTQFNLDVWVIDSEHFVVTDVLDVYDSPPLIISGHFTQQPSTPTISGTYAFTETGADSSAQPQAVGGILTCGSTGTLDVVPLSGTVLSNQSISATCGAVSNGRGTIAVAGAASSGVSQFAAYPTVDQGLYLIELDGGATGSSGVGLALPQTLSPPIASAALNGNYVSNFSASTTLGSQAFAGQIAADGVSALTGTGDVNSFDATAATPVGTPSLAAVLSGSFTAASNGRFPITLTIIPASGQPSPQITNLDLACYVVNANTCMLLGLDATAPGTGMLLLQNTGL